MEKEREQALELLESIDSLSREYDSYEFGLPLGDDCYSKYMIDAVLERSNFWISVKDRLPLEDYTGNVLFVQHGTDVCFGYFASGLFYEDNTDYDGGAIASKPENVTYWMPLPKAPRID